MRFQVASVQLGSVVKAKHIALISDLQLLTALMVFSSKAVAEVYCNWMNVNRIWERD